MDAAKRGAAALEKKDFATAISEYTAALKTNPNAVDYYLKRSTAHQRSSQPDYTSALTDAESAVILAHKRAKRELIADAQLRRGIVLFLLERYGDAEFCFGIVKRLNEKDKTLPIWTTKVQGKIKALPEDDEKKRVTIKEIPEKQALTSVTSEATDGSNPTKAATLVPKPVEPTPANKIKHDWYQSNESVTFTLLAKGVPKDRATVDIEKDSLTISFPIADSSQYDFSLDPLYAEVDPSKSSYKILSTKIEITLIKAAPGVKWKTLEGAAALSTESATAVPYVHAENKVPAYPSSSKTGTKDWDKVATDLTAKKSKKVKKEGEEDDGDDEDNYDYDDDGGDETNRFFRHLYKGATSDQQRAMMKSFQESGGTVLSTDWNQVGSKFVAPEPPDGMEAKKY